MKDQDNLKIFIDRLVPVLGWLTLIGIALLTGLLVLGIMTFAVWLVILFVIKIIPLVILVAVVAIIWKLLQERRMKEKEGDLTDTLRKEAEP